jgi:hypothetical protein
MTNDVHFYANGNDPFIFPLDVYTVYVHAGADPWTVSRPVAGSGPRIQVAPSPGLVLPPKTRIPPPMALARIHGADEMRVWLSEVELALGDQPVRFRLDAVSGPFRPEIPRLLEGLQGSGEREVSIDIVGWSGPEDG